MNGLILPPGLAAGGPAERAEEASRPWTTVEELYQLAKDGKSVLSRGRFKGQLRKMAKRGEVEFKYVGRERLVRLTTEGRALRESALSEVASTPAQTSSSDTSTDSPGMTASSVAGRLVLTV